MEGPWSLFIVSIAAADDLKKRKHIPFEYKPDYVTHKLKEYYVKAGIVNANVHSLRKTFGSVLLQNNLAYLFEEAASEFETASYA